MSVDAALAAPSQQGESSAETCRAPGRSRGATFRLFTADGRGLAPFTHDELGLAGERERGASDAQRVTRQPELEFDGLTAETARVVFGSGGSATAASSG